MTIPLTRLPRIPYLLKDLEDLVVTVPTLIVGIAGGCVCAWYYFSKHWLGNNMLGISFSLAAIEQISLGSVKTASKSRQ